MPSCTPPPQHIAHRLIPPPPSLEIFRRHNYFHSVQRTRTPHTISQIPRNSPPVLFHPIQQSHHSQWPQCTLNILPPRVVQQFRTLIVILLPITLQKLGAMDFPDYRTGTRQTATDCPPVDEQILNESGKYNLEGVVRVLYQYYVVHRGDTRIPYSSLGEGRRSLRSCIS